MSDLPIGWARTSLENVVDILDSRRVPLNAREREKRIVNKKKKQLFPYYGATGHVGYVDDYIFDEPLLLLGEDGVPFLDPMRPKAYLVDGKYWVNNHAHVLKSIDGLSDRRYLCAFLNIYDYREKVTGTTRLKLTQEAMRTIQVPFAPFNEQKRIAEKLDSLLARVGSCQSRLERVPQILKRFRQSVLAAATSGRLTKDWRDGQRIDEDWKSCSLGDVITDIRYGTAKKSIYKLKKGKPVLRIPNIVEGKIDASDLKFSYFEKKEIKTLSLKTDDLLLIRSNGSLELVGKVAVVDKEFEGFLYAGYLIRLRFDTTKVNPRYISYYLSSPVIRNYIEMTARSTSGVNNINSEEVKAISLDLPSLKEQAEILRRIKKLFAYARRLETRYDSVNEQVEQLIPSLLAKAFRGELVKQNPNDESAKELIYHIMEMRNLEEVKRKAEPRKKKEKKMSTDQSRKPLYATLMASKGARLTPDQLFSASGYEASFRKGNNNQEVIDTFYEELRSEIKKRRIKEERPNSKTVYLIGVKS